MLSSWVNDATSIEAALDLAAEGSRVWPWGNWHLLYRKTRKEGRRKTQQSKNQWNKGRGQGYKRSVLGRRMGGQVWEAVEGRGNGRKSKMSWRGGEQTGRHKHEVKPFLFLWEKLLLSWVTFFSQTTALLTYWWWWWCRPWKTEQSLFYSNLSQVLRWCGGHTSWLTLCSRSVLWRTFTRKSNRNVQYKPLASSESGASKKSCLFISFCQLVWNRNDMICRAQTETSMFLHWEEVRVQ